MLVALSASTWLGVTSAAPRVVVDVRHLRIDEHRHAGAVREGERVRHRAPGDHALLIIRHHDHLRATGPHLDLLRKGFFDGRADFVVRFEIDARHLLVARCHDAHLGGGAALLVRDQARGVKALGGEFVFELRRRIVRADHADQIDRRRPARAGCARRWRRRRAAPLRDSNTTTGTGASGEMRPTRPIRKRSSITSPSTTMRREENRSISSCARDAAIAGRSDTLTRAGPRRGWRQMAG